ncbi:MAG TPA: hypothetical protein VMC09_19040 [Anaerolineales bacterium]|nr:hypothetical protein [Anaerolineales bacterium]
MKNGTCPKCNSTEVYRYNGGLKAATGECHFEMGTWSSKNVLLNTYLCTQCGYTEMYVSDAEKDKIPALIKDGGWAKV